MYLLDNDQNVIDRKIFDIPGEYGDKLTRCYNSNMELFECELEKICGESCYDEINRYLSENTESIYDEEHGFIEIDNSIIYLFVGMKPGDPYYDFFKYRNIIDEKL